MHGGLFSKVIMLFIRELASDNKQKVW
jgi:hypothetical protein